MPKAFLSILTLFVLITLLGLSGARAQSTTRFEYVRAAPYGAAEEAIKAGEKMTLMRAAYRACQAADNEWVCRNFAPTQGPNSPERQMLSALGAEGWELVSVVEENNSQYGLTYLFKRPAK